MTAGRFWRTVRHLKARQITGRLARSVRIRRPAAGSALGFRAAPGLWFAFPVATHEWQDERTVCILGRTGRVAEPGDWQRAFPDRLRLYHLHYLDQLRSCDPRLAAPNARLLERWVKENPPGSIPGWEPYPTSRRVVNCIVWALQGGRPDARTLQSVADQVRWLRRNIETHLLANHLLANAKALVFAGCFYAGPEADEWAKQGLRILAEELAEQVLDDGGHIERSPMYHGLVLLDLLDLLNLGRRYPLASSEAVPECIARMLSWFGAMRHPDGSIPLFNDSALGVAPSFADLAAYADDLGVASPVTKSGPLALLRESGYARLVVPPWCLFVDAADIGPGYQPGHAHADTLSFELSYDSHRILVDTGVSTYERGPVRDGERGTAAHNTLSLDGMNSSEVWHAFRVGHRARVTEFSGTVGAGEHSITAAHDGYRRSRYRALHRRSWRLDAERLSIDDELTGRGEPSIELAFHFHPECAVRLAGPDRAAIETTSGSTLELRLDPRLDWRLDTYHYAPRFGARQPATVVRGGRRQRLPCQLHIELSVKAR